MKLNYEIELMLFMQKILSFTSQATTRRLEEFQGQWHNIFKQETYLKKGEFKV